MVWFSSCLPPASVSAWHPQALSSMPDVISAQEALCHLGRNTPSPEGVGVSPELGSGCFGGGGERREALPMLALRSPEATRASFMA